MALGFAGGASAVFAAQKVARDAIGNAVSLGEQINKTAVVFRGPGAQAIQTWSKGTAKALGISQREALEAAGTFGNMLVPMGFARGEAAGMSKNMVNLAADMASFNEASPTETLDALRSGLAGETEPLRRFGVFLNDARLKQQALAMGLYEGTGPLDANAKAQATYALILKDTKDAQGDFSRTSGSLANQQKTLRAQYENVTASIGKHLIPTLSFLVKNLDAVVIVAGTLTAGFLAYKSVLLIATIQQQGFNLALLGTVSIPGLIIVAIIALIGAFVLLYKKCEWFRNAVNAVWAAIKTAFTATVEFVKKHWDKFLIGLGGPLGLAVVTVIRNWDRIKQAVGSAIDWMMDKLRPLWEFVKKIGEGIGGAVGAVGDVAGKIGDFVPGLQHGGVMRHAGMAVVGEAGPELVHLPRGAEVIPMPAVAPVAAVGGAPGVDRPIQVQLVVDGRVLAETVARHVSDKRARR